MKWEKRGKYGVKLLFILLDNMRDIDERIQEIEDEGVKIPCMVFDDVMGIRIQSNSVEEQVIDRIDGVKALKVQRKNVQSRIDKITRVLENLKNYNERYYDYIYLTYYNPNLYRTNERSKVLGCGSTGARKSNEKLRKLEKKALTIFHYFMLKEEEERNFKSEKTWKLLMNNGRSKIIA